jgi:hypothetical protein
MSGYIWVDAQLFIAFFSKTMIIFQIAIADIFCLWLTFVYFGLRCGLEVQMQHHVVLHEEDGDDFPYGFVCIFSKYNYEWICEGWLIFIHDRRLLAKGKKTIR